MPKRVNPQDRWETEFEIPSPGEGAAASFFGALIQRILNRTEWLKRRVDSFGSFGNLTASVDPTPNTLAIRNAQGALQDGALLSSLTVLKANGIYRWTTGTKWLRLARWTGFTGAYRGLFADLYITRLGDTNLGSRLRVRTRLNASGVPDDYLISIAHDHFAVITNAVLVQTGADTYELWAHFQIGFDHVMGVVGTSIGSVEITPYGEVESIVQDSPPSPISDGLYLEWNAATAGQTFPGPGNIVAAGRTPTSGYIRYDNGVQVAWATVSVGSGTWTYPAAFASTPRVLATAQDTDPRLVTITSVSTTAAGILRTDLSGTTQSGTVHLWAIGLWK